MQLQPKAFRNIGYSIIHPTMTVITVRRATPEDASGMMQVHLSCLTHSYPADYSEVLLAKWRSLLRRDHYVAKAESRTGWCYVAVTEEDSKEEVVGFGYLNSNEKYRVPKQHDCDLQIESLYVSAFHHKRGIGQMLMEQLERKARNENCRRIAIVSSMLAVRFYQKMDYCIVEEPLWFDIAKDNYAENGPHCAEVKILAKELSETEKL